MGGKTEGMARNIEITLTQQPEGSDIYKRQKETWTQK